MRKFPRVFLGLVLLGLSQTANAENFALTPVERVNPKYPAAAYKEGTTGAVTIEVTVNPDGSVKAARVVKSEPPGVFDAAATEAILRWKFKPRIVDGKAVEARGLQPITFVLDVSPQTLAQEASTLLGKPRASALDLKEALRKLQQAISADPKYPWPHFLLARYYMASGWLNGGYVLADAYEPGHLNKAIGALEDALRLNPRYVEAQVYLGYVYAHAHQHDKARASFARARELGRSDWLEVEEAELDWQDGSFDRSKARIESLFARGTTDRKALWSADHYYLRACAALKDSGLARAAFDKFRKDFPADPYAPGDYAYNLMWYFGDFADAEVAARQAVRMEESTDRKQTLALALYGEWAGRIASGSKEARTNALLDEADTLYPAMLVGSNPALKQPTLQPIARALQAEGLYDPGDSLPMRVMRQTVHTVARKGFGWNPWLWMRIALGVFLGLLLRYRQRTRRRAAGVVPVSEIETASEPFRFTGSGSEYFRIWIVNLLLTILTLGIYSAWAKVRKLKYFYRNTELAGARFDYHGEPLAILKGRVVAVALLLAYRYLFDVTTAAGIATGAALAIVLPWLLCNSLRFRLRNTSYRGLRFSFKGSLFHAYYVFLVGLLGSIATGYVLAPFFHQRLKKYQHDNTCFGQWRFAFDATPWDFYRIYLKAAGMLLLVLLLIGIVAALVMSAGHVEGPAKSVNGPAIVGIVAASYMLIGVIAAPYFNARTQNLVWNHTRINGLAFRSSLSARRLSWLYLTNFLGFAVTLGFFMPWASVRLARYQAEAVSFAGTQQLEGAQAGTSETVGAVGQEAAEFFDIDIAL